MPKEELSKHKITALPNQELSKHNITTPPEQERSNHKTTELPQHEFPKYQSTETLEPSRHLPLEEDWINITMDEDHVHGFKVNGKVFKSVSAFNSYLLTFGYGSERLAVQVDAIETFKKSSARSAVLYAKIARKFLED